MKRAFSKLKKRAGETLAETLVAIFVVAIACLLLAGMVHGSFSIDAYMREWDKEFYEKLNAAELKDTVADTGEITVTIEDPAAPAPPAVPETVEIPVEFYGGNGVWGYVTTP